VFDLTNYILMPLSRCCMKLLFEQSNWQHIWIPQQNIQLSIGPPYYILGLVNHPPIYLVLDVLYLLHLLIFPIPENVKYSLEYIMDIHSSLVYDLRVGC
jgi:hypothetical protein